MDEELPNPFDEEISHVDYVLNDIESHYLDTPRRVAVGGIVGGLALMGISMYIDNLDLAFIGYGVTTLSSLAIGGISVAKIFALRRPPPNSM